MSIIYVLCILKLCFINLLGPIKEDSNFKDDEDPSVDYVDIILLILLSFT